MNCPYNCTFQGTQAEVDEHVVYMVGMGDEDHGDDKREVPYPDDTRDEVPYPEWMEADLSQG